MIKVIQLISTMNVGGAETMVKDYALLLNKKEIDVKIIALSGRYNSTNEKILQENGIEIIFLEEIKYGKQQKLNLFQKMIRKISRYYYFRKIVMQEKPDVLHIHLHIGNYLTVLPLKKLNLKLFYTVHNVPERFFTSKVGFNHKYFEYRRAYKLVHKYNMCLISLHDTMNKQLKQLFKTEHVETVNNGVMLGKFDRKLYNRDETRSMLGVTSEDFLVGHVGRFHEQKNHQFIISVFKELRSVMPQARLLLIGGGALKTEIQNQVHNWNMDSNVIFLENRMDVPALMCAMDVFFFPSRWEGFGNVLIEAQSIGLRCVISDNVPKDAWLSDRVNVLSLNDSIEQWIKAIKGEIKGEEASGNIEDFDMCNCVKKLQQIYLGR